MSRRVIAFAILATVLAGCSSIPTSGPIVTGDRVDVVPNDVNVRVIARPPSQGMTPEELVRGFLAACASVADGDDTARLYLTDAASAAWNPRRLIDVYDLAALTVVGERGDAVKMTAPLLGTIDAHSRYVVAPPGMTLQDSLSLVQVDGEWRISKAPRALYLAESDVVRSFRAHALYFVDASLTHLVPEFVLLPVSSASLQRDLLRLLLAGPRQSALHTGFPAGTRLMASGTQQDFGALTVALTNGALQARSLQREAMLAQVTWTLTQLPSVGTVRVVVNGQGVPSAAGRMVFSGADFQSYDPVRQTLDRPLVYVSKTEVYSYADGVRTLLARGVGVAEAAMSADRSLAVGISGTRRFMYGLLGASPWVLSGGGDLASPAVLPDHSIWYLDRETSAGALYQRRDASTVRVRTGLPKRARVIDFALAPDQSRIALIINDGTATTLRVGVFAWNDGELEITGLSRVEQRLTSVAALAWTNENELAVLGTVGAVAVQPILVSIPLGGVTMLGGPANPVSIAAAPGQPLVVGDQSGQLWSFLGGKWTASELGAAPHYTL